MDMLKNFPPSLKKESWECLQINPHQKTKTAAKRLSRSRKKIHLWYGLVFSRQKNKNTNSRTISVADYNCVLYFRLIPPKASQLERPIQWQTSLGFKQRVSNISSDLRWLSLRLCRFCNTALILTTNDWHSDSSHSLSTQYSHSVHPHKRTPATLFLFS